MKNLIALLLIGFVFSCTENKKLSSDQMRRFTFAAFNELEDTAKFQLIYSDGELQQILKDAGVVNYDYCTIDSISFFILDMEKSFDLKQTQTLIKEQSVAYPKLKDFAEIIHGKYKLLDRIFKLDQKIEFKAEEGQLIPMQKDEQARFVLTIEIINEPELLEEYVAVHGIGKAWPEITQNMKTVGVLEMELYLMGYQAFLIMDTKPDFDWEADGEKWGTLPREKEWQTHVAKFQKVDPQSKAAEKWKRMTLLK